MRDIGQPAHKKAWLVLGITAVLVVVAAFYLVMQEFDTKNYAQETALPLEIALKDAGGVKKCSYGDSGRGPDNQRPWYSAFYELPASRQDAIKTIDKVAASNGYKLRHASIENKPDIGLSDEFIDNWYFDNTSKGSPHSDLKAGQINLAVGVDNDGQRSLSNISCGTTKPVILHSSADTTVITIDVRLPELK